MKKIPGDKRIYYPLTHAQKRIYYDEIKYPGTSWANNAFLVRYKEKLDLALLSRAINCTIKKKRKSRDLVFGSLRSQLSLVICHWSLVAA